MPRKIRFREISPDLRLTDNVNGRAVEMVKRKNVKNAVTPDVYLGPEIEIVRMRLRVNHNETLVRNCRVNWNGV